ncbi:hypothetical protein [Kitasatospora sp. NPDC058190]|uniref:hypothetical protein n=1 Tax=Kitasatospora sp. NPDC058190 TaxID=3346371 RepID=UPI0036DA65EA
MIMSTAIERVVHDAEQQLADGTRDLAANDSALARATAAALGDAICPACHGQDGSEQTDPRRPRPRLLSIVL